MSERILGTEEEIRQYSAELEIALESIELHTNNLFRIESLLNKVKKEGISRIAMETLYSICPEALSDNSMPYMFTMESSQVHIEYAYEGFFSAIGRGIKWIFEQILEALKAIFNLIVSFINWLLGREENTRKKGGYSKDQIEKLQKERETILNDWEEGKRLYNDLNDKYKSGIDIKQIETFQIEFNKKYMTELDYFILTQHDGYTKDNLTEIARCISDHMSETFNRYQLVVKLYSDMVRKPLYGDEITSSLSTIKEIYYSKIEGLEDTSYCLLPFSYGILEKIFDEKGVIVPTYVRAKFHNDPNRSKKLEMIFTNDQDKKLDLFWGTKPGIKGTKSDISHLIKKWGKEKENALFYAPFYETTFKVQNMQLIEITSPNSIDITVLETNKKKIENSLDTIKKDLDNMINNIDKYLMEYIKNISFLDDKNMPLDPKDINWDNNIHPFKVVWPLKSAGTNINKGKPTKANMKDPWIKTSKDIMNNLDNHPVVTNIVIGIMFKGTEFFSLWSNLRQPILFLKDGLVDIFAVIARYNEINAAIIKDTNARKKIYDQIIKAHEKMQKEFDRE